MRKLFVLLIPFLMFSCKFEKKETPPTTSLFPHFVEYDLNIINEDNTPYVIVKLNGQDAIFMIDTGCSLTTINKKYIKKFNFVMSKDKEGPIITTVTSKFKTEVADSIFLDLDGLKLSGSALCELLEKNDLDYDLEKATGLDVVGILGEDIFRKYNAVIDLGKGVVKLYQPTF